MKPIIRVENISKQYRIGTRGSQYGTIRDSLAGAFKSPLQTLRGRFGASAETIWALKAINLEIQQGEIVGLIGHNGAGKSTLLKVLSRITEPTTGRIELYGRLGSLLEVGTGFHPELSGRENLFLNGAILGMPRHEIKRKFEAIVAFSEIEKFIDTPVKFYSSGMYLRLAFSIAVHLDPEILILDEVLAVGDTAFQIKCFNKIQEIRKGGRTIIFVSHSMQAITRLCKRAIHLSKGCVLSDGPAIEVVNSYLRARLKASAERRWDNLNEAPGNEVVRLRSLRLHREDGVTTDMLRINEPLGIEVEFEVLTEGYVLLPNIGFYNEEGALLFVAHDLDPAWRRRPRATGRYVSTGWVPGNLFAEGTFNVGVAVSTHDPVAIHLQVEDALTFQVVESNDGNSARGDYEGPFPGLMRPILRWDTEFRPRPQTLQPLETVKS